MGIEVSQARDEKTEYNTSIAYQLSITGYYASEMLTQKTCMEQNYDRFIRNLILLYTLSKNVLLKYSANTDRDQDTNTLLSDTYKIISDPSPVTQRDLSTKVKKGYDLYMHYNELIILMKIIKT